MRSCLTLECSVIWTFVAADVQLLLQLVFEACEISIKSANVLVHLERINSVQSRHVFKAHYSKQRICENSIVLLYHFICLHGELNFVIAVFFAFAEAVLNLLQVLDSLLWGQVSDVGDVFLSKLIDFPFLFCTRKTMFKNNTSSRTMTFVFTHLHH